MQEIIKKQFSSANQNKKENNIIYKVNVPAKDSDLNS